MGEVVSLDAYSSAARRGTADPAGSTGSNARSQAASRTPLSGDSPHPNATVASSGGTPARMDVMFDRRELGSILNVYGRMVAMGEWRDYAISHDRDSCTFAIYQRASEAPLFRVVKIPRLTRKQGAWQVIARDGRILKRGTSLDAVLRVFDRKRWEVIQD